MATAKPKKKGKKGKSGTDVWLQPLLLRKVAENLGTDWKKLGRDMGLKENTIESISAKHSGDLYELAYQVLVAWRQNVGHKATLRALQNHLVSLDRNDIVSAISKISHPKYYSQRDGDTMDAASDLLTEVQDKLKEAYANMKMKGLPWMQDLVLTLDHYYVDIRIMKLDTSGIEHVQESISIDKIFIPVDSSTKLSRILIEGGPGMGKSTLAVKLAYDWAKRQNYISHFDLVVLIPLRHYDGGLRDMICSAVPIKEPDYNRMLRIFDDISKNILFIMDGYDEISPEIEAVVLPMLRREVYSHTTVIVTSRPGKFPTNREEVDVAGRQINADFSPTFSHFMQKRISVEGFSSNQQKIFLEKHTKTCSEELKQKVALKLDKMMDKEFLKCPLFLLMLIVTATENPENPSENKTKLYKQIFNYVIRRYYSKLKLNFVSELDLFSYIGSIGSTKPPHIELVEQFGKFSLWAVQFRRFSFNSSEILKYSNYNPQILELGFLTQSVTTERLREKLVYEPVHKSLLEFAAAYGLWLASGDHKVNRKQLEKDIISLRPDGLSSLCFCFLVGLMGEKANVLFNLLLPYKSWYSIGFHTLYTSLHEIDIDDSTLKSLSPFLPAIWQIKWEHNDSEFSTSDNHKSIVRYGMYEGRIKQIVWYDNYEACMPKGIKVDTLIQHVHVAAEGTKHLQCKHQCKHLWYKFLQRSQYGAIHCSFKHTLNVSEFEQLSVSLEGIMLSDVNLFLTRGNLKNKALHWFRAVFTDHEPHLTDDIIEIIRSKKVIRLGLEIDAYMQNAPAIDKLLTVAAKSAELTAFTLVKRERWIMLPSLGLIHVKADLGDLCLGGFKSWEWVQLEGVEVECKSEIKKQFSIVCLELPLTIVSDRTTHVIQHCEVKSLTCPATVIVGCTDSWPLCSTLTELSIAIDKSIMKQGIASSLRMFQNLQVLILIIMPQYYFTCRVADWLIGSQNLLCLKGIEIWGICENPKLAKKLMKGISQCLQASLPSENSQTKSIQLQYLMVNCMAISKLSPQNEVAFFTDNLNSLKQPLIEKRLPCLEIVSSVISQSERLMELPLQNRFQDFPFDEGFRIDCDFWGEREADTIKSRLRNEREPRSVGRMCVTFVDK